MKLEHSESEWEMNGGEVNAVQKYYITLDSSSTPAGFVRDLRSEARGTPLEPLEKVLTLSSGINTENVDSDELFPVKCRGDEFSEQVYRSWVMNYFADLAGVDNNGFSDYEDADLESDDDSGMSVPAFPSNPEYNAFDYKWLRSVGFKQADSPVGRGGMVMILWYSFVGTPDELPAKEAMAMHDFDDLLDSGVLDGRNIEVNNRKDTSDVSGVECPVDGCSAVSGDVREHCLNVHGFWDEQYEEVVEDAG